MDPRLYIYELRRPRVSNPTFNSSHVNNTCFSIYSGGPIQSPSQHNVASSLNLPHTDRLPATVADQKVESRSRATSNLSNYGSSLLRVEDKDVYQKQAQRFNIISMEPVVHNETIKKYPKLTLEDKDAFYFRKMAQSQLQKQHQQQLQERTALRNQENTAGKHTYDVDANKVPLDLWNSYGSGPQKHTRFTAGMLNHADQFRSLI